MAEFEKYPMWMSHPNAQKSVPVAIDPQNTKGLFKTGYVGTGDKLAPVTVMNENEEAYYASRGYAPAGKSNPWAFSNAQAHNDPAYVAEEYPKWVGDVLVNSAAEEQQLSLNRYPMTKVVLPDPQEFVSREAANGDPVEKPQRKPHPMKGKKLGPRKPKADLPQVHTSDPE